MSRLQFVIADMKLTVSADFPISCNDAWSLFSDSAANVPDFTYHCRLSPQLPELCEPVLRYYDGVRERYYAATQESSDSMTIYLSEENLPWGTELMQLYPQLALPHVLLRRERLLLHASYILTDLGAIAFTAPSGTGKSTQADLWHQHRGAFIVNGDRCVVGLRDDAAFAYGYPSSGSSPHCHNRTAPLRAIVSLKQAKQNAIRPLRGSEAVGVLVNGCYLPEEYRADLSDVMNTAIGLVGAVPILELACLPDETAVAALEYHLNCLEG